MDVEPESLTTRAASRAAAKARRLKKGERRETYFDLLASGCTHQQIAARLNVSVASVRRAVDRAIANRRLDSPDRYVHLQVARLTKALRVVDAAVDNGDLKAIAPFVRLVGELDRYHGLHHRLDRQSGRRSLPSGPIAPVELLAEQPEPPLALTHAATENSLPFDVAPVAEKGAQALDIATP